MSWWHTHTTWNSDGFTISSCKCINPSARAHRINTGILFYRKSSVRICCTPQRTGWLLSVKHLGWKGTKGGAALWSPERCFPWQWNVFGVQLALPRVSTGSGYSRNRKTLQIIWQHMAPSEAACCQDRMQYSQLIVCVFVCSNNRTYSGTRQWRFPAQMWPMHPSFFLNYSFTEQCKMS